MPYYVMKTGLPMFDACRAYGLALIIERLAQAGDAVEDVIIEDIGPLYLVHGPAAENLPTAMHRGIADDLLVLTDGWCGVFLTTGRATGVGRLKPASRSNLEKKVKNARNCICNSTSWLRDFQQAYPIELATSSKKGFESLPASLDVSASKGIRRAKRSGYGEGEQLYVPTAHWAVGLIGGAHFIRWAWAGKDYAGLLIAPKFVTMRDHHHIKAAAKNNYLCGTSTVTVSAHYAVQLAKAFGRRKADQSAYADRYDSLVVQTMTYSVNQWKAQTGTVFPLEYPMRLIERDLGVADEVFTVWDHLFRWGSVKGNEMLALTLAEFLAQPDPATFEQYARVHLKMTIADEKRRPFGPYKEEWIKEVLHHV